MCSNKVFWKKLPQLPFLIRHNYQQGSINRWFLSSYKRALFIATISALLQTWITFVFLRAGDSKFSGNLWLASMDCPSSRTYCTTQKKTNLVGWLTFVCVVAVFLLNDLFSGLLLFYESSVNFNIRGIIAGTILLNITTLSVVASAIFLYATSISNISLIQDAVIVLFLNDMDEQVLLILQTIAPAWTEDVESNIATISSNRFKEISRVRDNSSDENENDQDSIHNSRGICHCSIS